MRGQPLVSRSAYRRVHPTLRSRPSSPRYLASPVARGVAWREAGRARQLPRSRNGAPPLNDRATPAAAPVRCSSRATAAAQSPSVPVVRVWRPICFHGAGTGVSSVVRIRLGIAGGYRTTRVSSPRQREDMADVVAWRRTGGRPLGFVPWADRHQSLRETPLKRPRVQAGRTWCCALSDAWASQCISTRMVRGVVVADSTILHGA